MSGATAARATEVEAGSGLPNDHILSVKYQTLVAEFSFSFDTVKTVATGYGAPAGSGEGEEGSGDAAAAGARAEDDYAGEAFVNSSGGNGQSFISTQMLLTGNEESEDNLSSKGNVYFEHIPIKWVVWDQHIRNVLTCSMSHASPTELLNIQMCVALFFILNFVGDFSTI